VTEEFSSFVRSAKRLAEQRGLSWELPVEDDGRVVKGYAWDLSAAVGDPPLPARSFLTLVRTRSAQPVSRPLENQKPAPSRLAGKTWSRQ
jgi:hypothetical protein